MIPQRGEVAIFANKSGSHWVVDEVDRHGQAWTDTDFLSN